MQSQADIISATSWLVANEKGDILDSKDIDKIRPIASITKLFTAMVVLDAQQDLNQFIGQYTRKQLLEMTLVGSNNHAAVQLCENYPGGLPACITAMNRKAQDIGSSNTKLVDPSGLDPRNVSTAKELIKLVQASANYPLIVETSNTASIKIKIKKKYFVLPNTNPVIGKRHSFVVSKTGYIRAAGGCIVLMLDTDIGRRIVVVLNSKNVHTRIPEAEFIAIKGVDNGLGY